MTPEGITRLKDHEGLRLFVYTDTEGKATIGYGRNLVDRGVSHDEASQMLEADIAYFTAQCRQVFPWFDGLDPVRQDVVVNLAFNMGVMGLARFHLMIEAIENQDWGKAAYELYNSRWRTQVQKERVDDLMRALELGHW